MKIATEQETSSKIAVISLVCACLVALSHVARNSAFGSWGWWFVRMTRYGVCCMAVPFFFTVSGYFLSRHFDEKGWWRRESVKRLSTLLFPYLFWCAAFFVFASIGYAVLNISDGGFLAALRRSDTSVAIAFGAIPYRVPFLMPLWYVRALLVLVALSPLIALATRRKASAWLACAGLFAVYFLVSPHRNGFPETPLMRFFYYGLSLFGAFYFCLGATLRRTGVPTSSRLADRLAGVALIVVGTGLIAVRTYFISRRHADPYPLLCIAIPCLVSGAWFAVPAIRCPAWLASMSFPIYVMHYFVVYALDGFVLFKGKKSIVQMIFETAVAVALPITAAFLLRRFFPKFAARVFGGRGASRDNAVNPPPVWRWLRPVVHCIWQARWWIVLSVALCAVDLAIQMCVLGTGFRRALRLWVFYSILMTIPVFLLGRLTRFVAPVLFGFWMLVEGVECWTAMNFRMSLNGNWILMLFSTSKKELVDFFEMTFSWGGMAFAVLVLAAVAGTVVFLFSKKRPAPKISFASAGMAALCSVLGWTMAQRLFFIPVTWDRMSVGLMMLRLATETTEYWTAYRKLARASTESVPYDLSVPRPPRLCVFVVGESTTRNHMGIYGYGRDTTPQLEAIRAEGGLTVFSNLTTGYGQTPEALCSLLTDGELDGDKDITVLFPAMLKKAGYRTELVSCQGHWQARDIVGTYLFSACDSKLFLQEGKTPGFQPDGIVLPEVRKVLRTLSESDRPLALFVHLFGCHFPPKKRVPPDFVRQWPRNPADLTNKMRRRADDYDTAVAYDDFIVASIIKEIAAANVPSCVFFVSDHGESPDSRAWRDVKSRDVYEIPLLIWLSPEYRAAFPETAARVEAAKDAPLRQSHLMEGMLELAGVTGYPEGADGGNFLSAQSKKSSPAERKESRP